LRSIASLREGFFVFLGIFLHRFKQNNRIMKKFLIVVAAMLMLSCSCRNEVTESRPPESPALTGTPFQGGSAAASITGCLSGRDTVGVVLKVSRVIDGDTFEGRLDNGGNPGVNPWAQQLTKIVVRINGIDAPERGQFYGDVATLHLQWLISGKAVGLKLKQRDMYGRWIATAFHDGVDIGAEMLKEGLAWHYKEVDGNPRYAQLEAEAKLAGLGLWCDDRAVPPWEWRRMSKYERDAYR
jgi:endonuclease YncB( thermonuclease family)